MARNYSKRSQQSTQANLDTGCTGLYIRVSTEKQVDEGFSLDDQQKRLLAHCEAQAWKVCEGHIYIDAGISGKSTEARKEYNRMLSDAETGKIRRIVALKLDRLARNVKDFLSLVDELKDWGCDLVLIKESFDTSTPSGKFTLTMFAALAEREAATITERVMSGKRQKASVGGYNGGKVAFGYTYADGKFDVVSDQADIVRSIFAWLNEGASLNAIMRRLNDGNVPTSTGKGQWSTQAVKHILANGAYAGIAQWAGIEASGSHPPIIDSATYEAAQGKLKGMTRGQRVDLMSKTGQSSKTYA